MEKVQEGLKTYTTAAERSAPFTCSQRITHRKHATQYVYAPLSKTGASPNRTFVVLYFIHSSHFDCLLLCSQLWYGRLVPAGEERSCADGGRSSNCCVAGRFRQ